MNTYSIQELCGLTSLPRRTIHFYVQQGIIPGPEGAGLASRYTEDHLIRLSLIPTLRREGMRLDEIRALFKHSSLAELREMAANAQPLPTLAPASPTPSPQTIEMVQYNLPNGIIILIPRQIALEHFNQLMKTLQDFTQSLKERHK